MELRELRSYLILAKHRHFERAAREIGISQPALSQQIKKLEAELDGPLVIRDRGKTRLTEAGKVLRGHASRIVHEFDLAEGAVKASRGVVRGVLRVGHSPSHRDVVEAAAAAMLGVFPPGLRITLEELFSHVIEDRIHDGRLDLGLVHARAGKEGLTSEALTETPLRLVVRANHPLAQQERIHALLELGSERFVLLRRGLRSRRSIDALFELHSFTPQVAIEVNGIAAALGILRRSTGRTATILPIPARHLADRAGLEIRDLPPPIIKQTSFLLHRETGLETEAARHFVKTLRQQLKEPGRGGDQLSY